MLILSLGMTIGYYGGVTMNDKTERELNGLYLRNFNKTEVAEYTGKREPNGDWVCINVAYEMDYPLAYETCVHECSHKAYSEIFAEDCEDDYESCLKLIKYFVSNDSNENSDWNVK